MDLTEVLLMLTEQFNNYEALMKEKKKNALLEQFCLTQREKEIYHYLEMGMSRIQIAQKLDITENTVKTLITRILKKISVTSSKKAVQKIQSLI